MPHARGKNAINVTANPASIFEQIAEMVEVPIEAQWAAIRNNVSILTTANKTLTAENAALKQARSSLSLQVSALLLCAVP